MKPTITIDVVVAYAEGAQMLQPILEPLQEWITDDAPTEPPVTCYETK